MSIDIETNYDRYVDVQRFEADAGADTEQYAAHLSDIPCHIQPLDDSYTEDLSGNFGKDKLMFCPVSDILEGDRVIDGDDEYRVVAAESFEFLGIVRHMELRIRQTKS